MTAQQISQSGQGRAVKRGVVLVLDTSGSMAGASLDGAKSAVIAFLSALPSDVQVGVVTAGAPSVVALRPTSDRERVRTAVLGLRAAGETALYDAVVSGAGLFGPDIADRRMVVLSDGADTASTKTMQNAEQAVAAIPTDTIAFKTKEAEASALATLAAAGKGKAYKAGDGDALRGVFAQAAGAFSVQLLVRVTVPRQKLGQAGRLVVEAKVAGSTVATDLNLTFVPDTRVATPLVGTIATGTPVWVQYGLIVVIFIGLLGLGVLLTGPLLGSAERRRRLAQVQQFEANPRRSQPPRPENESAIAQAALQMSEQLMKQANAEGRLARQLDRAGMRLRPHEWLLLRLAVLLVAALLLALVISPWPLGFLLGLILGWGSTAAYHRVRAARRLSAFVSQLPDALQLVIGSLRSGFSLTQSLDAMLREMGDPISTEFGRALGETRLGANIEDALDRVAARMKSKDLAFVVVAIRVQREIGGNLAQVLATTVGTMRERAMLHRQVQALSAEGRLSAYVLIALPVAVLGYLIVVRAQYLTPLIASPVGLVLIFIGLVELIVGTIWMLKVVKVEV
ncbi:MAG: VWA domain-containing protein [Hamadaea sp.]|nr:VWA domain-containing protein [Hamadaea sp.]